ncbi:hypothetical protein PsorP6_003001 [Peronosclerospora sorghi]|uniref:Uncharacterized protein n=1 Tax=Peronosclerospora sorghi TaxID=230839 RepID=A0ACC0VPU2_9STRA|nr:hypothetical protein PsorP6_003001 [Peronosclerospora sorghi]
MTLVLECLRTVDGQACTALRHLLEHVATQREEQRVVESACIGCPLPVELVAKFLGYLRFSPQWHVSMSIASRAEENAAIQALEKQGIETLERVHDVRVDVNHWLEQSIVDASLAKCLPWLCDFISMLTLLQIAARSRSRSAWRLVPPTLCDSNTKLTSTRTRRQTAPREFIKRPEVRTVDGDVIDGFRTREYEYLCLQVLQGLRTKWLQSQGYYSLQALFLNQVELNIWFYWKRQQKDAAATIPRRSLVSKIYWVRE